MADQHERFERLAVGHVVGGLDEVDNARFRTHLLECRQCRSRVAELRAIDSSLIATERDARTASRIAGAAGVATRADEEARSEPGHPIELAPARSWPWRLVLIGMLPTVVLVAIAGMIWVRAENQLLRTVNQAQAQVLEVIASGDLVELTGTSAVRGVAAADERRVVLNITGLPAMGADEGLVIWLLGDTGETLYASLPVLHTRVVSRSLTRVLQRPSGATELVVTIERLPMVGDASRGARLLAGPIPRVGSLGAGDG